MSPQVLFGSEAATFRCRCRQANRLVPPHARGGRQSRVWRRHLTRAIATVALVVRLPARVSYSFRLKSGHLRPAEHSGGALPFRSKAS
jgi:hypothetical protein